MIQIREIIASEYLEQARELMLSHWHEVAEQTGMPEPTIDIDGLKAIENAGLVLTLGAFDGEVMVGYSINIIANTFNFADLKIMQNEGLFLNKEYRGKLIGVKLIKESERLARARGAVRAQWHTYLDSEADALFTSMHYPAYDRIFSKEL